MKKVHHLLACIQQTIVHVDVEHQGAVLHLSACYVEGLVVTALGNEAQELAATGHVAPLADSNEGYVPVQRFKSANVYLHMPTKAFMCSGVVPQHPPIISVSPSSIMGLTLCTNCSGLTSYCPIELGKPALG